MEVGLTFYLNVTALVFILLVASAVTIASWNPKDPLFWIRTTLLFIPAIAEVRQILLSLNLLHEYPLFILIVYLSLRLIGPMLNWQTQLQVNKKIAYFSPLNLITYLLIMYIFYQFGYVLTLNHEDRAAYLIDDFTQPGWFSFTYPIVQIVHVGEAIYWSKRTNKSNNPDNSLYFIKIALYAIIGLLLILQISYVFLARTTVELIVAPIIFMIAYIVILFVSIRFSSVHNKQVHFSGDGHLKVIQGLSAREHEVLKLISQGKSDKEISTELHLSLNTIRTYCKRIYAKLELKNRTEAANFYHRAS